MTAAAQLRLTPLGLWLGQKRLPCTIGKGGIRADKREGDGATPAGSLRIMGGYFRPDRLAGARLPDWILPIRLGDLWSDDPRDPQYNHLVRAPHRFSHEQMRRSDPMYDLVLYTDWNWPEATKGAGSAIFLHSWRRPCAKTAGCVAMAQADLIWLARRITPGALLRVRA